MSKINHNTTRVSLLPFMGGLILYGLFWPESFGNWLGTMVHAFRLAAGPLF